MGGYVTSTCIIHIKVDLHLNGVQGWVFTIQQPRHTKLEKNIPQMFLVIFSEIQVFPTVIALEDFILHSLPHHHHLLSKKLIS